MKKASWISLIAAAVIFIVFAVMGAVYVYEKMYPLAEPMQLPDEQGVTKIFVYEDDGESTDYLANVGTHTRFEMKNNVLIIHPAEGAVECVPHTRSYCVSFKAGISGAEVFVNGKPADASMEGDAVTICGIHPTDRVEIRIA